jgi:hypothetical protein
MTFNLNAEVEHLPCDPTRWTALQTEMCMNVALAKRDAFIAECGRAAEYVRLGFLTRTAAADHLHETAFYNSLYFEYGADHIQRIMAGALNCEVAA